METKDKKTSPESQANNPAKSYNPLYIYGGAGLGKTHLMNAIGHATLDKDHRLKIIYITTDKFMNDLINHLQYGKILDFRKKYRSVDILLIDDIHYLTGRERTKEEFFNTFNHLYDSEKQIVISSDCPPKEIPNMEERFSSRFEWGSYYIECHPLHLYQDGHLNHHL